MPRDDGLDGAHYQFDYADPNLQVTHDAGYWWIGWKASQSTSYADPTFPEIRQEWLDFNNRLPYHWLSSITNPITQAEHYLDTIGGNLRVGEAAMLDLEEVNLVEEHAKPGTTVARALAWFNEIEPVTKRPSVCYNGLYVAGGSTWKSPELRESPYGRRPFTLAAYVNEDQLRFHLRRTSNSMDSVDAWQFSSSGPVPGIVGRCDRDQINHADLFHAACYPSSSSVQTEDDMRVLRPAQRVYDSRNADGPLVGTRTITIHPDGGDACAVNITVIGKSAPGYLVAFAEANPPPTSNVNFLAGQTVANQAIVPMNGGAINVWASSPCDVIVDLEAVWPAPVLVNG